MFCSLGYETTPRNDFGFKQRSVQFSGACKPGAKERLWLELLRFIGNGLPDEPGMIRLCTEAPSEVPQNKRCFEDRWIDVPEAKIGNSTSENSPACAASDVAPLVVSLNQTYVRSGNCVVTRKNTEHVGFNGKNSAASLAFRRSN